MNTKIPKPTTPIVDERTGFPSRAWILYWASLASENEVNDLEILLWMSL